MGICASCLGLSRRAAAANADESSSLLHSHADSHYGATAALSARAGLDHLAHAGQAGSPPRRRLRDPAFERKERDEQERICAETNARYMDVSWRPAGLGAGDEPLSPTVQQHQQPPAVVAAASRHADAGDAAAAASSGPRTQTEFLPEYVLKFRETFGQVPEYANMQLGKAMDARPDWLSHIMHNNGGEGENWDPENAVVPAHVQSKLVMAPEEFLGAGDVSAAGDIISPAA